MEYFDFVKKVNYEGEQSSNPFAFKFYDPDRVIFGKKMSEHLPFAMAWWHNLGAAGADMFGVGTADKSFGAIPGTMEHARAKVDVGFEFMEKLGIKYFCFHDVDLVPEDKDINVTNARLDEISDYILEKMNGTDIRCLWGTANMFGNPRFMNGAGSTNDVNVYCFAAAQIKKALDITVKLGGRGYVFWGGREGYETLLNTDVKFEQENIASLMHMAVEYGRSIGFEGDFYIEPKPKEPMTHQYDFDAATAIGFLRQYGLDKDFKLNIEANHATLAGHTFQHELRISAINGMYEVLKNGGLTGGFNFDAKNRRTSNTAEDMFYGYILGMDTFALGLIKAAEIIESKTVNGFIEEKYASFNSELGQKIRSGEVTLSQLSELACEKKSCETPCSGRQEKIQGEINRILFK